MNEFENHYFDLQHKMVMGLDEAGRGPLAGPLVVAGVCFKKGYKNDEINDSKKLSEKKRDVLFDQILKDAVYYEIVIVDTDTIDKLNIYQATKQAMIEIASKNANVTAILSDAMRFEIEGKVIESIIKGDQKSISIAAASILAKVTRDKIMYEYDKQYPAYGFAKHKGYPTKQHLAALDAFGVLDIHRKSYGPVAKKRLIQFDF